MKKMTGIKFLLSAAVLLNGLAAFSENAVFAQKAAAERISSKSLEKSAEALVENSKVIVRVVAVKEFISTESEFVKPKNGNKFMAVQIVIDNTGGTQDWEVIPNYFKLKDAENNTFEPYFFSLATPKLNNDIVDGGDSVKGWITFEISNDINIKSLKLRYEYNGYTQENFKSGWIFLSAIK